MRNVEETVQVGDMIRPIFIPSVSTSLTTDREHYYTGTYKVEQVTHNFQYPLDGETEGFGTVAHITVNQNLNSTARQAFAGGMESDRYYYVSHFEIIKDDIANPVIELTEHEKEIARLKELNRVQSDRITKLLEDVEHNSRVLTRNFFELKERHGWCDQANETAGEINGELRGGLQIECEEEYEIEMEVEATMRTTITAMVTASSREQAESMVMEDPSMFIEDYQITDALSWEGWHNIDYELA